MDLEGKTVEETTDLLEKLTRDWFNSIILSPKCRESIEPIDR